MFKKLKSRIRYLFSKDKLVIASIRTKHDVKEPHLLYIEEPNIDRLLFIGFIQENRGYRLGKATAKYSTHVLPTGRGWQVHVDKCKGTKHRISKGREARKKIKGFINRYKYYYDY